MIPSFKIKVQLSVFDEDCFLPPLLRHKVFSLCSLLYSSCVKIADKGISLSGLGWIKVNIQFSKGIRLIKDFSNYNLKHISTKWNIYSWQLIHYSIEQGSCHISVHKYIFIFLVFIMTQLLFHTLPFSGQLNLSTIVKAALMSYIHVALTIHITRLNTNQVYQTLSIPTLHASGLMSSDENTNNPIGPETFWHLTFVTQLNTLVTISTQCNN